MKIGATKTLVLDQFPSKERTWLNALIIPVNLFFEQVYRALSRGLTVSDNLKSQEIDLDIGVSQVFPMKVAYKLNERPNHVIMTSISEVTPEFVAVAPHVFQWRYEGDSLVILITGLNSAKRYKAKVLALV